MKKLWKNPFLPVLFWGALFSLSIFKMELSAHHHHDHIYISDPWYHRDHVYIVNGNAHPYYYYGNPYYYYDPRFYYAVPAPTPPPSASLNLNLNFGN